MIVIKEFISLTRVAKKTGKDTFPIFIGTVAKMKNALSKT